MKHIFLPVAVLALLLVGAGCVNPANTNQSTLGAGAPSDVCTAAPNTSEMGDVSYPIADRYAHLGGLGMFFTADDCGPGRFQQAASQVVYWIKGGHLSLVGAPSDAFRGELQRLGFECVTPGNPSACTEWLLKGFDVQPSDLLRLKPYVDEIKSESCASCG